MNNLLKIKINNSIDDIIWLLLCSGQPAALLEEIAVSVGKTLSCQLHPPKGGCLSKG